MLSFKEFTALNEDVRKIYSLDDIFNRVNKAAFNNSLDKSAITLRWSKSKKRAGECKATFAYNKETKQREIQGKVTISISHLFDMSEEDLLSLMAHEMIHADHFIKGEQDNDEAHGSRFIKDAKRVSKAIGVNIPVKHDGKVKLASKTNAKDTGYILIKDAKGYSAALFTPAAFNEFMEKAYDKVKGQLESIGEVTYGIKQTTLGSKYKLKRTFKSFSLYVITDEEAKELQ